MQREHKTELITLRVTPRVKEAIRKRAREASLTASSSVNFRLPALTLTFLKTPWLSVSNVIPAEPVSPADGVNVSVSVTLAPSLVYTDSWLKESSVSVPGPACTEAEALSLCTCSCVFTSSARLS